MSIRVPIPELNKDFYMDGFLAKNLDAGKELMKNDWDFVFNIDGVEGGGKSTLAQQCMYYLNPKKFNIENIGFDFDQFENIVFSASKHTPIIMDEATRALSSRGTMSAVNKRMTNLLAECRQQNLYIALVMPTFCDMDKYGALWRSRFLLHVFTGKGEKKGHYAFFSEQKKKKIFLEGRKYYNYNVVKPDFTGRFDPVYTVDEAAYREKKRHRFMQVEHLGLTKFESKHQLRLWKLIQHLRGKGETLASISHIIDMDPTHLGEFVTYFKPPGGRFEASKLPIDTLSPQKEKAQPKALKAVKDPIRTAVVPVING